MDGLFVEKQVDLGNSIITYLEGGITSNSDPILFLHGWGVLLEPYQGILNLLAQRYRVIAPYLPGLGKSTAPNFVQDYSDYAELIVDFLSSFKQRKFHVIGHSLGGAIAIAIAVLKPSVVSSVIVADSTGIPLVGSVPEAVVRRAIEMVAQMGQMKPQPVMAIVQCLLYNSFFHSERVWQMALLSLHKDIRPMLGRVQSPCLIVWAKNDLLTPLTFAKEFSQLVIGSKLKVIEGAYHEWLLFFPEKFVRIVTEFIKETESSEQLTLMNEAFQN